MLRAVVIALAGSAALAGIAIMSGPAPAPAPVAESRSGSKQTGPAAAPAAVVDDLRPAMAPASVAIEVPRRNVRDVTPRDLTAGPVASGALIRVAPPPKPTARAEPESVEQQRTQRLFRPVLAGAGLVVSERREIRLAGIQAPGPEQTCGEGASAWPCGRMARAALRRFVRGRAIECHIPAGADAVPDEARCLVAGLDLSEWLVAQGWAEGQGDAYGALEAAARDGERGLWASRRPDAQLDMSAARVSTSGPPSAGAAPP